ncbi:hypothetical protein Tco_0960725 [Tanacetum coccineum]
MSSSFSLQHYPCAFCEEGRCAPYFSFRSVLTAAPENREKAIKLLACILKARLERLFARVSKSEVDVEEVLNGLLDQIHERDIYPVIGIQTKIEDTQKLVDIVNQKLAKAEKDLKFYQQDIGFEKSTLDRKGMNLIDTGLDHATATLKIENLKEQLIEKGYTEEFLGKLIPYDKHDKENI